MSETSTPTQTTEPSVSSPTREWNPPYYEMEEAVEQKLLTLSPLDVYRVGIDPVMDMGIQVPETWAGPPDDIGKVMLEMMFEPRGNRLNERARKVLREVIRHSTQSRDPNQMTRILCRVAATWLVEYAADLRANTE